MKRSLTELNMRILAVVAKYPVATLKSLAKKARVTLGSLSYNLAELRRLKKVSRDKKTGAFTLRQ